VVCGGKKPRRKSKAGQHPAEREGVFVKAEERGGEGRGTCIFRPHWKDQPFGGKKPFQMCGSKGGKMARKKKNIGGLSTLRAGEKQVFD